MLREHCELWRAMDELDAKLSADTDPADLREHCQGLLAVLDNHNKKEEPVVYPRADSDLTKRAKGAGLGLAFCSLVIKEHGGEIKVEDAPGGGSDFIFWLPKQ